MLEIVWTCGRVKMLSIIREEGVKIWVLILLSAGDGFEVC